MKERKSKKQKKQKKQIQPIEMTHIILKHGQRRVVRTEGEIALLSPVESAHVSLDLESYYPSGRIENLIGIGTTAMIVIGESIPTAWLDDPRQPKPDKTCCEKHPEPPTSQIGSIEFNKDGKSIDVKVSGSHPCGIRRIVVFVQDISYNTDAQGVVTKKYTPYTGSDDEGGLLKGEFNLEDPFPIAAGSTAEFPHDRLWGEFHAITLVVISNCDVAGGFRFSRVTRDFLLN